MCKNKCVWSPKQRFLKHWEPQTSGMSPLAILFQFFISILRLESDNAQLATVQNQYVGIAYDSDQKKKHGLS